MGITRVLVPLLIAGGLFISGCAADAGSAPTAASSSNTPGAGSSSNSTVQENASRETIDIGISLYLLVDDVQSPDLDLSSRRTQEELIVILAGMNQIWRQADIHFQLNTVSTVAVPNTVLAALLAGDLRPFFNELGRTINVPGTAGINGFYARGLGGPNGITVPSTGVYFVMDTPSVFDRRVSSHEVGHILGLEHTLSDRDRLLYPGTNGMTLTPEEADRAREVAQSLTGIGR